MLPLDCERPLPTTSASSPSTVHSSSIASCTLQPTAQQTNKQTLVTGRTAAHSSVGAHSATPPVHGICAVCLGATADSKEIRSDSPFLSAPVDHRPRFDVERRVCDDRPSAQPLDRRSSVVQCRRQTRRSGGSCLPRRTLQCAPACDQLARKHLYSIQRPDETTVGSTDAMQRNASRAKRTGKRALHRVCGHECRGEAEAATWRDGGAALLQQRMQPRIVRRRDGLHSARAVEVHDRRELRLHETGTAEYRVRRLVLLIASELGRCRSRCIAGGSAVTGVPCTLQDHLWADSFTRRRVGGRFA